MKRTAIVLGIATAFAVAPAVANAGHVKQVRSQVVEAQLVESQAVRQIAVRQIVRQGHVRMIVRQRRVRMIVEPQLELQRATTLRAQLR